MNKSRMENNILWYAATIMEWVIVPLYIATMGYEIDISIYQKLKNWEYVAIVYYVLAGIDIALFGYFAFKYRKEEQLNMMLVSVFCCLVQIILLISKVKI